MSKFLNLFRGRRDRLERDLDRELRYHVDRRVADLVEEGLSEPEARRQARLELGGVPQVQEAVRDTWISQWLDTLVRDVRYAIRSLTRSWGFTLGAGAVLAVGTGASVAIFSVVSTVLLQPLPYPEARRIISLETLFTSTGQTSAMVSGPDFLDWRARNDVFEKMAAYYGGDDWPAIVDGRAMFANYRFVSADFFEVFSQTAFAGRLLTGQDVPPPGARHAAVVVAYDWAVTHFGSAKAAVGKTLGREDDPTVIVGVAAPGFRYPGAADFWFPFNAQPPPHVSAAQLQANRANGIYQVAGKLKPGILFTLAAARMRTIGDNLTRENPENRVKTVTLVPLQDRLTGSVRVTLWVLMSAVGVLWLIACANIANLLLARATGRTHEIALRAALGAGRGRVVRQLLTESCVLAGVAGLAGLLLASMLIQGVVALSPANLPRIGDIRMNATVLVFALGLSLTSTLLFGLAPALHASRLNVSDALKRSGSKLTASGASTRLRSGLVVAELALSVVLLVTAGLLVRSLLALQHVDLGFTKDHVLVAYTEYGDEVESDAGMRTRIRFYADMLDRLRAVPGVSAAAGVAYVGMGLEPRTPRDYSIEGRPQERAGERPQAEFHAVTEDYFKTLEIPLLAGRDFARTDTRDTPPVVIINEIMARSAFPGESPIGKRLRTGTSLRARSMEIIGVVGDTRMQDPSQPAEQVIYAASNQGLGNSPSILVRTSLDEASLVPTLRRLLNEANPTVPVKFETMAALFDDTLAYPRFRTRVITLFASVAAFLAAVGIFSVLAHLVGQRTRELAVRRALGARATDVIGLVVGHGLRLVAIGLMLGLAGALALARLLTGLLYEISPWDVGAYLGTIIVLGSAALLATLLPAMRAAMIAPVIVLQQE